MTKSRVLDNSKKLAIDNNGQAMWDESFILITCVKNRPYERLFTVKVPKEEIFTLPVEIVYEDESA